MVLSAILLTTQRVLHFANQSSNTKENKHINNEERFAQEEVNCGDSTSARGATPDFTD